MRPAWLEIDLDAIGQNLSDVRQLVGPGVDVIAVIKSNAYGHGAVPVARRVLAGGAKLLGVALIQEAIELREAGITAPMLVLGTTDPSEAPEFVEYGVMAAVGGEDLARALSEASARIGKPALCHIKIDTGMGRQGVRPEAIRSLGQALSALPNLSIEGVFSHFASSSGDTEFTEHQRETFLGAVPVLETSLGRRILLRHLANSGGIVHHHDAWLDAVRPGALLYGISELNGADFPSTLRQAMSLKAKIVFTKGICAGDSVGYGRAFVVCREACTAVLPLGYADGYPRSLTNNADVLVHGKRCPVLGRISMDSIVIDVTEVEAVQVGDEAVLLGRQGDEMITTGELAKQGGTIVEEICARMAGRLPRVYTENGDAEGD